MYLSLYLKYIQKKKIYIRKSKKFLYRYCLSFINGFLKFNDFKKNFQVKKNLKNKKNKFIYFKKFKKLIKYFNLNYKKFNKKLPFSFKQYIISNRHFNFYNTYLIESRRFELFCLYFYKYHYLFDSIYNFYCEDDFFAGATPLIIFKNDYNYLSNKLYNLYSYFK